MVVLGCLTVAPQVFAQTPATQTSQPSVGNPSPASPSQEAGPQTTSVPASFTVNLDRYYSQVDTLYFGGITVILSCQWYFCDATASGGGAYVWTSNWNTISTSAAATVNFPGEQSVLWDLTLYSNGSYVAGIELARDWAGENQGAYVSGLTSSCTPTGYCTLYLTAGDPEGAPVKVSWDMGADGSVDQSGLGLTTVQHNFGVVPYSRVHISAVDPFFEGVWQIWRVFPAYPSPSFTSACFDDRQQDDPPDHTYLQCSMTYTGEGPTPSAYHWYWQTPDGQWWKANATNLTAITVRWSGLSGSTQQHPVWLAVEWDGALWWYQGTAPGPSYW